MNKDDAVGWHKALCMVTGALSGALSRGRYSPRLVTTMLATLRPIVREMEIDSFKNEAQEQTERAHAAEGTKTGPAKSTERVRRKPARVKRTR